MYPSTAFETSIWDDVWALVDKKWHEEFRRFVDTGQASNEFLAYVEGTPNCQEAIDLLIEAQAEAFQKLAEVLKNSV